MLKILGRKSSANVQKVHWICSEGNIEFEAINIGGKYKGHNTEDFKKINPNGTIPVLVEEDFSIYESNSIIKYISRKFDILNTNNTRMEALNNQWIDWSSLVFGLPCSIYTAQTMLLPKEDRDDKLAAEAKKKIISIFSILEKQLQNNNFILENKINLADIPIGCWFHRCNVLGIEFASFNYLRDWYLRLKDREAFKKAVLEAPLPPH